MIFRLSVNFIITRCMKVTNVIVIGFSSLVMLMTPFTLLSIHDDVVSVSIERLHHQLMGVCLLMMFLWLDAREYTAKGMTSEDGIRSKAIMIGNIVTCGSGAETAP